VNARLAVTAHNDTALLTVPQVSELTQQQAKAVLMAIGKKNGRPSNYMMALRAQAGDPVVGKSSADTWQALIAANAAGPAAAPAAPARQPQPAAPQQQRAQPVQRTGPAAAAANPAAAASPAGSMRPPSRVPPFTPAPASRAAPAATADGLARTAVRLLPCAARVTSPNATPADLTTYLQVLAEVQQQPPLSASLVRDAALHLGQWSPLAGRALARPAGAPQPAAPPPAAAAAPAAAAQAAALRQPATPAADGAPGSNLISRWPPCPAAFPSQGAAAPACAA
jgi:hypothetical protein